MQLGGSAASILNNWPHVGWKSLPHWFLRPSFFCRTASKHVASLWHRFVLRAFCVPATTDACFSYLFLPTFNCHLLCCSSSVLACRTVICCSASLSPDLTVSTFVLACSCLYHVLHHQAVHFAETVFDDLHQLDSGPLMKTSCHIGCDGGRCTQVLTAPASWRFKVSALFSKTSIFGHAF